MGKYRVTAGQNIYDVALHLYGSIEGITDLMICNPALSLDDTLSSGQELVYTDQITIDADITAWFRNQGIVPSGGERRVYPKTFALPLKAELHLEPSPLSAAFTVSASRPCEMEIDWGDNSPADHQDIQEFRQVSHTFDNTAAGVRRVRLYGDPALHTLDLTGLKPKAVYLFDRLGVENFILKDAQADIGFIPLLDNVRTVDLGGTALDDLLPLLACKSLMSLDLSAKNLKREAVDLYLIALVERYYGRRSCTVRLQTEPSGQYSEPERDENGRYLITSGMEAVWVLTHEESWNQAGAWRIVIGEKEYTYQPTETV